jgi:hypothetical protein
LWIFFIDLSYIGILLATFFIYVGSFEYSEEGECHADAFSGFMSFMSIAKSGRPSRHSPRVQGTCLKQASFVPILGLVAGLDHLTTLLAKTTCCTDQAQILNSEDELYTSAEKGYIPHSSRGETQGVQSTRRLLKCDNFGVHTRRKWVCPNNAIETLPPLPPSVMLLHAHTNILVDISAISLLPNLKDIRLDNNEIATNTFLYMA